MKVWLLAASLVTIALLATAALQENYLAEWYQLRTRYAAILESKATDDRGREAADQFEVRIVQNYIPALGAVDRCTTCHAGMQDPRMLDQPQPFRTHPGEYLRVHDPEKFGCTVCHQGQGRATQTAEAHGDTPHWEYPLLPGRLAVASCTKCHAEVELHEAEGLLSRAGAGTRGTGFGLLATGRLLVQQEGCLGCHVIDGRGGTLGPDLTHVGDKTRHGFDFSHLGRDAPRDVRHWLTEHFLDPGRVSPGSAMPPVADGRPGAEALTAYMLSLRRPAPGGYFQHRASVPTVESGAALYAKYCSACHGADGRRSDVPDIRTPALNSHDVLAVAGDDFYRFTIANGRHDTAMPAWGEGHGNLSREQIDAIVAHIRGWQPPGALASDVTSQGGNPDAGRVYYRGLCAGCHGSNGEGGIGNSLRSATFLAVADDRFLARSIIDGRPGTAMPAWKQLSSQSISDLLAYIRTWQAVPPPFAEVAVAIAAEPTAENVHAGRSIYDGNCRGCHGAAGRGGIGPSLTSPEFLQIVDDRFLYRAITEGRPTTAMPAWRHLPAASIGAIIAYLRSFARGTPPVLHEMPVGDFSVGQVLYDTACTGCHGPRGSGGVGPQLANRVLLSSVTDAMLFQWIAHGREGTAMKGFLSREQGPLQLDERQIADIIAYLRYEGTGGALPQPRTGVGNPKIGAELFAGQCASCHGQDGAGASGPQLNNPSFLEAASDGFLTATIVLGRSETPMAAMLQGEEGLGQLAARNVQDVIAYMRLWGYPRAWRHTRRIPEMSTTAIAAGKRHYEHFCAGCHGPRGLGSADGPGYFAPALNNQQFLEAATDGFLLATIARGRSGTPMRPFGRGGGGIASLSSTDMNHIVSFIRSWQRHDVASNGGGKRHEEM